ncbi:MAG: cation:proton antiporter [Deltaproteobacteria bacterium]|nr:cation:proton antiporter [Deltaproteobacteria bacterium]
MSHTDVVGLFAGLGLLLLSTRFLGNWAERFRLPCVFGELLAGVILGPTILGRVFPDAIRMLFPTSGPPAVVFNAITILGISAFLLLSGLEIGLTRIRQRAGLILAVSAGGFLVPFVTGILSASFLMDHAGPSASPLIFTLFFATAMSITALPVIVKILKDLKALQNQTGAVVIAAASINDLGGWLLIALILKLMPADKVAISEVAVTGLSVVAFVAIMLTLGRMIFRYVLVRRGGVPPEHGSLFVYVLGLGCLSAAFAEWLGVHAIFGAFVLGLALGDLHHVRSHVAAGIERFVTLVMAPLFFGSIGLQVDFAASFDGGLIVMVLALASAGKLLGSYAGARMGGLDAQRSWATGFAMNARGAMEIAVGTVALRAGIISGPLFVALVIMSVGTSLLAALALKVLLVNAGSPAVADMEADVRYSTSLGGSEFTVSVEAAGSVRQM